MLLRAVKHFPAPVIATLHGSVCGESACDLVMACDIVLSDETGAFAITPQSSDFRTTRMAS
jgi:methylmalonyl-CoA decarboxylase